MKHYNKDYRFESQSDRQTQQYIALYSVWHNHYPALTIGYILTYAHPKSHQTYLRYMYMLWLIMYPDRVAIYVGLHGECHQKAFASILQYIATSVQLSEV